MNELPLRVQLVPITGANIETNQWACPKCHCVWKDFDLARACCASKKAQQDDAARSVVVGESSE
jgi:Zn-finger nucleic acid-binding protein